MTSPSVLPELEVKEEITKYYLSGRNTIEENWQSIRDQILASAEAALEPAPTKKNLDLFDENLEVLERALNVEASANARVMR